jgi:hypothetical protein
MDAPTTPAGIAGWWVVVIAIASLAAHIAERFTRKLIPLSALLRLTLAFPDRAPSRFRVALQAGNITQLRKRLTEATATGDQDLAEAAELILALSAALSKHDRRTRGHSERTRAYTDLLAEELGISPGERDKLRWAALLHDVGKLEVPAEILNKPGRLEEDEWHAIRQHPVAGMKLIAPIADWLGPWAMTVEHHHERWNGEGYPHGLQGEDIALGARVVSVADAYDVMISGRSYQARMTHSRARIEVARHAGTQFDPRVVRALMNIALGRLRWSTGPLAALADVPLLRPLEALGRDVATVLTAGLVTVTAGSGMLLPFPDLAFADWLQPLGVHTVSLPEGEDGGGPASDGSSAQPAPGSTTNVAAPEMPSTTLPGATTQTSSTPTSSTTGTSPTVTTTTSTPPTTTAPPTTTTTAPPTTTTAPLAPIATDDEAATRPSDKINISVLGNDAGSLDQGSLAIVQAPAFGTAAVGGGGKIRYSAPSDFTGLVTFTYQVCNTQGQCSTATVSVTVA